MDIHQKVGERLFFLGAEVNCAQAAESGKKKDITTEWEYGLVFATLERFAVRANILAVCEMRFGDPENVES